MYDPQEREYTRHELKQRYNRRFFIAAHIIVVILLLPVVLFVPGLRLLLVVAALTLLPHALYVAYGEYQHWVEHKLDRKLHGGAKPKRYPEERVEPSQFRLTDDGEIEPVAAAKPKRKLESQPQPRPQPRSRRRLEDDEEERETRRQDKRRRRRKDDTDEFDVKSLLEKLKDLVD